MVTLEQCLQHDGDLQAGLDKRVRVGRAHQLRDGAAQHSVESAAAARRQSAAVATACRRAAGRACGRCAVHLAHLAAGTSHTHEPALEHLPQRAWCEVQALAATWLPDGSAQTLATGASDGVARVWDVRAAAPAANRFAPHTAPLLSLAAGAAAPQLLASAGSQRIGLVGVVRG